MLDSQTLETISTEIEIISRYRDFYEQLKFSAITLSSVITALK